MCLVGSSNSGKSRLMLHLITHPALFVPRPRKILLFYDQYQHAYVEAKRELEAKHGIELLLYQGFDEEKLNLDNLAGSQEGPTLIIIDDFSDKVASSQEIARIATNGRHKNIGLILILHTLFHKHPASRVISANTLYYFFLPSVRLASQLKTFAIQLGMKDRLCEAYADAIRVVADDPKLNEHRYLLLDLHPQTEDLLRVRTRIHLPFQVCYI